MRLAVALVVVFLSPGCSAWETVDLHLRVDAGLPAPLPNPGIEFGLQLGRVPPDRKATNEELDTIADRISGRLLAVLRDPGTGGDAHVMRGDR